MTPDLLLSAIVAGCNVFLAIHADIPEAQRAQFWSESQHMVDGLKALIGHAVQALKAD